MTEGSQEYIFQGYRYLLEENQIKEHFQFSLIDPVVHSLLSVALQNTLKRIPYFQTRLCLDGNEWYLAKNDRPCIVYCGKEKRRIPEDTNGYLFYISCDGNTVYSEWLHFITDARGIFSFLSQLVGEYCMLCYHVPYKETFFHYEPGLTWTEIAPYYKAQYQRPSIADTNEHELGLEKTREMVLHIEKKSVIDCAQKMDVKPFSLLLAVFCSVIQACRQSDNISIGYPVDFRRNVSHANAFYNCVTICRHYFHSFDSISFKELVAEIDHCVRESLQHDNLMSAAAQDLCFFQEISKNKANWKVKKRTYEMYKKICFIDLIFSYIGHFPSLDSQDSQQLHRFLTDAQFSADNDLNPLFVEGLSLNGQMILSVKYRYQCEDMPGLIRSIMESLHIQVNSIKAIQQETDASS